MSRVVMFLSNPFRPDPRVAREAGALAKHGHRVTVICWDRQAELPEHELVGGVEIVRVQNVRSGYGSGWRQLFYLPRFWRQATRLALALRPDVVHCHDLDTLYAGCQLKKGLGCRLVYDAHEHYPALMSLYLPQPLVWALTAWERYLIRRADVTITASTVLRDEFSRCGIEPVIALGNHQELAAYAAVTDAQTSVVRAALGVPPETLLVAYIGGFSRNRQLLPFIEAASLLPETQFHLWGDGPQRDAVEQAIAGHPNAHYHGWLPAEDLPSYFKAVDVIYYCLRLDYPGAIYNAPNTLSQAMAAGCPLVANDVGDLGRTVRAAQCGVLIAEATPRAIAQALRQLEAPATRGKLGQNGLQAAQSAYNAAIVQRQLIALYQTLLEPES